MPMSLCLSKWWVVPLCLLAIGIGQAAKAPAPSDDPGEVRKAISEASATWSRARVAYDHAAFERLLAPDFYVSLADQRIGRADFVAHISALTSPGRLVRFDSQLMTLAHPSDRNEWVAVVISKMEWEPSGDGASAERIYGMWTTREGYRRVASGGWQLTFTEEIGSEYWGGGQRPPFPNW
jgi:hypothetical protein